MLGIDLEVFLAVARGGSHAKAGKLLSVDATTVGRRLGALERALGAKLFQRDATGLSATAAGRALLPRAERVEAELSAAARELQGRDARVTGTVRITGGDGLVHDVLVPLLPALLRAHPGLSVELRADTRTLDLSRREADVALRLSRPREAGLVARKLAAVPFGLYASPEYLVRRGTPRSLADLSSHDFVAFEPELDRLPQNRWLTDTVGDLRPVVRANTTVVQTAACVAGLGIALFPTFVARREARLVRVLAGAPTPSRDLYAVVHGDLRENARVRAVLGWLAATVAVTLF